MAEKDLEKQDLENRNVSRRRFLKLSAGAALGLAGASIAAACSPAPPASPTAAPAGAAPAAPAAPTAAAAPAAAPTVIAKPSVAQKFTVGVGAFPRNLDPAQDTSTWAQVIYRLTNDTLVTVDNSGKPIPLLADSWRNVDPKTWEIKLKPGIKFHNGEPMDAAAVKYTIERLMDPKTQSGWIGRVKDITKVTAVDPQTVRIETGVPFGPLMQGLMTVWMIPPKYAEEKGVAGYSEAPVGTGPFKFKDWKRDDHITLVPNPDYFGPKPKLEELTFRLIQEPSTRLASVLAGEIDAAYPMTPDTVDQMKGKGLQVVPQAIGQHMQIEIRKTIGGPLADKLVRQAMNYAIDKEKILKGILLNFGQVSNGQILGPDAFGYNPDLKAYPYDPAKAKQLLAQAGFANGFETKLNGAPGRYVADQQICEAIVQQLGEVGIKAQLEMIQNTTFSQKFLAGEIGPLWTHAWQYLPAMDGHLPLSLMPDPAWKIVNDPNFTKKLSDETQAVDSKDREAKLKDMMSYMREEAYMIYLFQFQAIFGVQKNVANFVPRADYTIDFSNTQITGPR